jgi:hypothetical protein
LPTSIGNRRVQFFLREEMIVDQIAETMRAAFGNSFLVIDGNPDNLGDLGGRLLIFIRKG